jgi:subtilisin family serine protease
VNAEKLHPPSLRATFAEQQNEPLALIVLARPGANAEMLELTRDLADRSIGPAGTERLALIEAVAIRATVRQAADLSDAPCIGALWRIPAAIHDVYVRIIRSLGDVVENGIRVANISLAPPPTLLGSRFDPDEPMNLATRAAAAGDVVVVFAAANYGPAEDSLNPWSVAPWVLSVGAASEDGERLADFSSRGIPRDLLYRPTVVAPGIDRIVAHPRKVPKTQEQLEAEKRIGFSKRVPWLKRAHYTVVSGTSFACPEVSGVAGQIIYYIEQLKRQVLQARAEIPPDATWAQIYTHRRAAPLDDRLTISRVAGKLAQSGGASTGSYPFQSSPAVVKQIIMDMALDMPGYQPHEVGAGFVSQQVALHYFGAFGPATPQIASYKVL